jgi:hypothetical protein
MDEPTAEEILQREERGFADALLFVASEADVFSRIAGLIRRRRFKD